MKASAIVAIARETIGTPYKNQGRVNGLAVDCAGVPVHVAKRIGRQLHSLPAGYQGPPPPAAIKAALDANLERVPREQMQIGDIVWLTVKGQPMHMGVLGDYYLGGFTLIHAQNGSGLHKVVEHRIDDSWSRRIVAVWRFPGVEL